MRILVLQLTRMGDVIQTSPLTRTLKEQYPGAHITMMVRSMGKTVAERNPFVDDVLVYDEAVMFADLRSSDSYRLLHAYETAERYAAQIRDGNFDRVINCTHSISSAVLLALAGVKNVTGAHLSGDFQLVLRGPWTNYFFTSVFDRHYNSLNLCDIVRGFAQEDSRNERAPGSGALAFSINQEDRDAANGLLHEAGISPDTTFIAMQLGASQENKRWPVAHFAALASDITRRQNFRVVLVGVKEEARFGEEFDRVAPGVAVSLFGKTSVPQLGAVLERARMLVTNDTGTMHIAAAVKCPVVLVSVGFVHFRETGPYGEGHLAIERRRDQVGAAATDPGAQEFETPVKPENVWKIVQMSSDIRLLERRVEGALPAWDNVDVYESSVAPDGCLEWYPIVQRSLDERTVLLMAYRAMWLEVLRGTSDMRAEVASFRLMISRFHTVELDALEQMTARLCQYFEGLLVFAKRGSGISQHLLTLLETRKFSAAKPVVADLVALDEEIRVYGEVYPQCKPLVLIARYERENLEGMDPLALAQTTLDIYGRLGDRARRTIEKVNRIVEQCRAVHRRA